MTDVPPEREPDKGVVPVLPDRRWRDEYLAALSETDPMANGTILEPVTADSFDELVERRRREREGTRLWKDRVPATELWLVEGDRFVGRVSVRHRLDDRSLDYGGHIGFWIRPSRRRQGYGTHALRFGLAEAKRLDIPKVLLTADADNFASQRIIESGGGAYEDTRTPSGRPPQRRYWITLTE